MKELGFIYFGFEKDNVKHNGITCIGYFHNIEMKQIEFAICFCSPKDIFSKKKARKIIKDRFNSQWKIIIENINISPKYKNIVELIRTDVNRNSSNLIKSDHSIFPSWFDNI